MRSNEAVMHVASPTVLESLTMINTFIKYRCLSASLTFKVYFFNEVLIILMNFLILNVFETKVNKSIIWSVEHQHKNFTPDKIFCNLN